MVSNIEVTNLGGDGVINWLMIWGRCPSPVIQTLESEQGVTEQGVLP